MVHMMVGNVLINCFIIYVSKFIIFIEQVTRIHHFTQAVLCVTHSFSSTLFKCFTSNSCIVCPWVVDLIKFALIPFFQ